MSINIPFFSLTLLEFKLEKEKEKKKERKGF